MFMPWSRRFIISARLVHDFLMMGFCCCYAFWKSSFIILWIAFSLLSYSHRSIFFILNLIHIRYLNWNPSFARFWAVVHKVQRSIISVSDYFFLSFFFVWHLIMFRVCVSPLILHVCMCVLYKATFYIVVIICSIGGLLCVSCIKIIIWILSRIFIIFCISRSLNTTISPFFWYATWLSSGHMDSGFLNAVCLGF